MYPDNIFAGETVRWEPFVILDHFYIFGNIGNNFIVQQSSWFIFPKKNSLLFFPPSQPDVCRNRIFCFAKCNNFFLHLENFFTFFLKKKIKIFAKYAWRSAFSLTVPNGKALWVCENGARLHLPDVFHGTRRMETICVNVIFLFLFSWPIAFRPLIRLAKP